MNCQPRLPSLRSARSFRQLETVTFDHAKHSPFMKIYTRVPNSPIAIDDNHKKVGNDCSFVVSDRTLHCVSQNFKCSLRICSYETVLQLSQRLGEIMKRPPSELVLICKGKVISRHPMFTLEALGAFSSSSSCKLLITQRPPGPNWLLITTVFLCSSSLSPLIFCMHADSPVAAVKGRVRDLLRCPVAVFSLHLADGAALPDAATLRDLGVAYGDRIYCRIRCEEPEAVPPSVLAAAAAAVREQVRQADAAHDGRVGCKRRRGNDEPTSGVSEEEQGARDDATRPGARRATVLRSSDEPTARDRCVHPPASALANSGVRDG